jgi:hypothetical protein
MKIEAKPNCPLNKFKPCKQLECSWFIKLEGKHPQTGKDIEEWGCSIAMLPILMVDSANAARNVQAATESFRNIMVKQQEDFLSIVDNEDTPVKRIK